MTECCDPKRMFAVTKENSPIGKVLWYDGEIYHYHTVTNETYPIFVQVLSFIKVNATSLCWDIELVSVTGDLGEMQLFI